jgi:hypothetical protein
MPEMEREGADGYIGRRGGERKGLGVPDQEEAVGRLLSSNVKRLLVRVDSNCVHPWPAAANSVQQATNATANVEDGLGTSHGSERTENGAVHGAWPKRTQP